MKKITSSFVFFCALTFGVTGYAEETEELIWATMGGDAVKLVQQSLLTEGYISSSKNIKTTGIFNTYETKNSLQDGSIQVVEFSKDLLPKINELIHDNFNRCGGFIFFDSREGAFKELSNSVYSTNKSLALAIPQLSEAEAVNQALPRVSASRIVDVIRSLENMGTRYYQHQQGQKAAEWVKQRWLSIANGRSDFSVKLYDHPQWLQDSVIGEIRGSRYPDEIIVIGGHLDSINHNNYNDAPGADDDASGIAVVTETLNVLMDINFKPERTIQFMAYAAEEVGLRGSTEIAEEYRAKNKNVIGVLQMDMVNHPGSSRNAYLLTDYTNASLNQFIRDLAGEYNSSGTHYISHGNTSCGYACSDHASWYRNSYPTVSLFEALSKDINRNLHTSHDTLSESDSTGIHASRFAKLSVEFLIELAKGSTDGSSSSSSSSSSNSSSNSSSTSSSSSSSNSSSNSSSTSSSSSSSSGSSCSSPQYAPGTNYSSGQTVKNIGNEYRCNIQAWCSSTAAWAYEPGVGLYWTTAWSLAKSCNDTNSNSSSSSSSSSSGSTSSSSSSSGGGACGDLPEWSNSDTYLSGDQVQYNNTKFQANWWTSGQNPEEHSGPWGVWTRLNGC